MVILLIPNFDNSKFIFNSATSLPVATFLPYAYTILFIKSKVVS